MVLNAAAGTETNMASTDTLTFNDHTTGGVKDASQYANELSCKLVIRSYLAEWQMRGSRCSFFLLFC